MSASVTNHLADTLRLGQITLDAFGRISRLTLFASWRRHKVAFVSISLSLHLPSQKRLQTPVQPDVHFDDVLCLMSRHGSTPTHWKKNWISHTPGVLLVRICLRHKSNLQQAKPRDFPADLSYSVPLRGSATLAKALTTNGPATTPKEVDNFFFILALTVMRGSSYWSLSIDQTWRCRRLTHVYCNT